MGTTIATLQDESTLSMCNHEQVSIGEDNGAFANSPAFCRIFIRQLNSLYKLGFLLTTNHFLAEQCTLASLDEALNAKGIPKSAAESWSKRLVIKNALRIVRREFGGEMDLDWPVASTHEFIGWPFDAIIRLQLFERVVFVLSVLERFPDHECSRLLSCPISEIGAARIRALELLSKRDDSEKKTVTDRRLSIVLWRGERAMTKLRRKARKTMNRTVAVHATAPNVQPEPIALECI